MPSPVAQPAEEPAPATPLAIASPAAEAEELLETLESAERAGKGTVHLKPNRQASKAHNTRISALDTREKVQHVTRAILRSWNSNALEEGSIKNQLAAVRN